MAGAALARLPGFKLGLCASGNSVTFLHQVSLITHGVDVRLDLACDERPINIIINIIL